MSGKLLGALMTLAACGYLGYARGAAYRLAQRQLRELICALEYMESALSYHMPGLTELCHMTSKQCTGTLQKLFLRLSALLSEQSLPDASICMDRALQMEKLCSVADSRLQQLGKTLGSFDLQGQLLGLAAVKAQAQEDLAGLQAHREEYIRLSHTLALCIGMALVILLI